MREKKDGIQKISDTTPAHEDLRNLFREGLMENDRVKLLKVSKSDPHNHSTKHL